MKTLQSFIISFLALCAITAFHQAEAANDSSFLVREGEGTVPRPTRVLLTGDSLMASLGPQLKRALDGYENLTLIPIGKGSTGLARPDFYNWPKVLEENMIKHKPHVVVMWIGTNDTQNIYGMKGLGEPLSWPWQKAYHNKLIEIFRIVRKHNARLIMMSPPVMNKQKFDDNLKAITNLMEWTCKKYGASFLNTRPILSDSREKYVQRKPMADGKVSPIRTPDQIHITADGNILVMDRLLPHLSTTVLGNNTKKRANTNRISHRRGTSRSISGSSTPHSPRAFMEKSS